MVIIPSNIYRTSYPNEMLWNPETNFRSHRPRIMDFIGTLIDGNRFYGNKCRFCRKNLDDIKHKTITSKHYSEKLKVCSNCYRLYKLFYPQIINKKIKPKSIIEIYRYIDGRMPILRPIYRKKIAESTTKKYIKPCYIKVDDYDYYHHYLYVYYKMKNRGCYFCQKRLIGKYIELHILKPVDQSIRVRKMCMDCDYLFRTIYREFKSKNRQTIRKIYEFITHEGN